MCAVLVPAQIHQVAVDGRDNGVVLTQNRLFIAAQGSAQGGEIAFHSALIIGQPFLSGGKKGFGVFIIPADGSADTVSHLNIAEPRCQRSGVMSVFRQLCTELVPSQIFVRCKLLDFVFCGAVSGDTGDFSVIALSKVGGDLREGNFRVGGAQNGIAMICACFPGHQIHAGNDIGQMALHGKALILAGGNAGKVYMGQIGHDVVGHHIKAVVKCFLGNVAVGIGSRNQVAQVHGRLLRVERRHGALIGLIKPVVGGGQIHQIIQLPESGVAVAAVGVYFQSVAADGFLGNNHIRQEEIAEELAVPAICHQH